MCTDIINIKIINKQQNNNNSKIIQSEFKSVTFSYVKKLSIMSESIPSEFYIKGNLFLKF